MPYYSLIQSQFQPIEFCAAIANDGLNDVDSGAYTVQIPVSSFDQSETFSLQAGIVDTICLGTTFMPNGFQNYFMDQTLISNSSELNLLNNNFENAEFVEDWYYNAIYARDNFLEGVQGGIVSINELGIEYSVGNVVDIFSTDYTHGVSIHVHPDAPIGSSVYGLLYIFEDSINDWVWVNQTLEYVIQNNDKGMDVHLYFAATSGPYALLANRSYLVLASTYSWGDSSTVFATAGNSKPNTSFYNNSWNWANLNLSYLTETPMVRLLFNPGSLDEYPSNFKLNIAPNPSNESTTLSFELPSRLQVEFEVIDLSRKVVHQTEPSLFSEGENQFELRTDHLNNGVYFVKFHSDFGSTTKRIVIQH